MYSATSSLLVCLNICFIKIKIFLRYKICRYDQVHGIMTQKNCIIAHVHLQMVELQWAFWWHGVASPCFIYFIIPRMLINVSYPLRLAGCQKLFVIHQSNLILTSRTSKEILVLNINCLNNRILSVRYCNTLQSTSSSMIQKDCFTKTAKPHNYRTISWKSTF